MPFPRTISGWDYRPPTGFGAFRLEFDNRDPQPVFSVIIRVLREWEDAEGPAWTQRSQDTWRNRFLQDVPPAWNDK